MSTQHPSSRFFVAVWRRESFYFLGQSCRLCVAGLMAAALFWCAAKSDADTTSLSGATEITSMPYVISQPGVYYLNQNFTLNITNANAITVAANGVTIDFNGHTISDLEAGSGVLGSGIYAPNGTSLTVRNGTILGFTFGFTHTNPADNGILIENMRFIGDTFAAINICASACIVRNCQMYQIGGSPTSYQGSFGVLSYGSRVTVQNCDVGTLMNINPNNLNAAIYFASGSGLLAVGNRINGAQNGVCFPTAASGKYRDNLCAASVTVPYTNGIDAGDN